MNYNYYNLTSPSTAYGNINTVSANMAPFMAALSVVYFICFVILVLQIIAMWKIFTKAGQAGWKALIPVYNLVVLYKIIGLSPWLLFVYLASFIPVVGSIAILVLLIFQDVYLAKSFGKGTGFTIGLIFLSPIFYMILGFSKDAYIGPNGNAVANN